MANLVLSRKFQFDCKLSSFTVKYKKKKFFSVAFDLIVSFDYRLIIFFLKCLMNLKLLR